MCGVSVDNVNDLTYRMFLGKYKRCYLLITIGSHLLGLFILFFPGCVRRQFVIGYHIANMMGLTG